MHKARTRGSERSQANLKKHFRFALAWHQLESQFALLSTRLDSLDSVNTKRTVNLKHWHKIVRIIPAWGRAKIPWFIVKSDPLLQGYRAVRLILYPPISVEYIYLFIYLFTFSIFSGVGTGQTSSFLPCYAFEIFLKFIFRFTYTIKYNILNNCIAAHPIRNNDMLFKNSAE